MVENREIRRRARQMLGGGIFTNQWVFALLVSLIGSAIIGFTSSFIIGLLVIGIVNIGVYKYYLSRSRNKINYDNFEILVDGVKGDIGGNVGLGLLITIFTFFISKLYKNDNDNKCHS